MQILVNKIHIINYMAENRVWEHKYDVCDTIFNKVANECCVNCIKMQREFWIEKFFGWKLCDLG